MKNAIFTLLFFQHLFGNNFLLAQEGSPSIETTKLAEHIYKFFVHGYVNTVAVVGSDGVLLVDSGFEPVDLIRMELNKIGNNNIKYIINTHSNGDHTYGNSLLGQGATIISSRECRMQLSQNEKFPLTGLPDITFNDSVQIYFNGEDTWTEHIFESLKNN